MSPHSARTRISRIPIRERPLKNPIRRRDPSATVAGSRESAYRSVCVIAFAPTTCRMRSSRRHRVPFETSTLPRAYTKSHSSTISTSKSPVSSMRAPSDRA